MSYFKEIPCGKTLPLDTIHAVSVSMPKLEHVIAYEEGKTSIRKKINSGYPRFVTHPYLRQVEEYFKKREKLPKGSHVILFSSLKALGLMYRYVGRTFDEISEFGLRGIIISEDDSCYKKVRNFLQHTGVMPSSRRCEEFLLRKGLIDAMQSEEVSQNCDPIRYVKSELRKAYGTGINQKMYLTICGMNAVYASYSALQDVQRDRKRDLFIQFGWLYLDTQELMVKFGSEHYNINNITALDVLEKKLSEEGHRVAAIYTEVTTNPLIQAPDLPALKELADRYDIPIVVDTSLGSPYNVDVVPYADIITESLTKFASGSADVIMGVAMVTEHSPLRDALLKKLNIYCEAPYIRDIERVALGIEGYEERVRKNSANGLKVAEYLEQAPFIKEVFWSYSPLTKENYKKIEKYDGAVGGVVSFSFTVPLEKIYDKIPLPKGPTFGTEFPLLMPYMYLAHYDLVSTSEGRKQLEKEGMNPDLLRLSVGMEDADKVIAIFEKLKKYITK